MSSLCVKFQPSNTPLSDRFWWVVVVVNLQAKSLDQELTLFYPCHKKNNKNKKKNKNPLPKYIRKGSVRRLKFDTQTTHGLLAEFRGLGVHFTRRTRTTIKIWTQNFVRPTNFFQPQNFFKSEFFFRPKFFGPKLFYDQIFFQNKNFFQTQKFFQTQNFFESKFFQTLIFWT